MADPAEEAPTEAAGDAPDDWEDALDRWRAELDERGWITLAEAEAATGVSRSALRAWYRRNEVPSRVEEGPHGPQRLVHMESLLDRVARSPRLSRRAAEAADSPVASPTAEGIAALVELLATQLDRAEARAERAETALRDAQNRAARAEAERDFLLRPR